VNWTKLSKKELKNVIKNFTIKNDFDKFVLLSMAIFLIRGKL